MTSSFLLPRKLLILALVLPLAALMGYLLATPDSFNAVALVGLVLGVLTLPLFMRWHHPMLIFAWNAALMVFFLPGMPALWMPLAGISLMFSVLARVMDRESPFLNVPVVTWSLLCLALVVLVTMKLTGGIGLRSLGSGIYGGRKFASLLGAILAYFALSCQPIPRERARAYVGLFALAPLTGLVANLAYFAGPSFYFIYYLLPTDLAMNQAMEDFYGPALTTTMRRLGGFTFAGMAAYQYMVMRFGLRGVLDYRKPLRLAVTVTVFGLSLLGGYRSALIITVLSFAVQFYLEGLVRTRLFPILLIAGVLGAACVVPLSSHLPLSVQRTLSFLPIEIDPAVRADALGSIEWRVEMWKVVSEEIPRYFWLGKGYAVDPSDLYLAEQSQRFGYAQNSEVSMVAGDYHSGPLSVLIPFGIFGTLSFAFFLGAGVWVLYRNYRYGDPALQNINTALLTFFLVRIVFLLFIMGGLSTDIQLFAGWLGLSVAFNGGVASRGSTEPTPATASPAG